MLAEVFDVRRELGVVEQAEQVVLDRLDVLQRLLQLFAVLEVVLLLQLVGGALHLGVGHVDLEGLAVEGVLEERIDRRLGQFDGELAHGALLVVAISRRSRRSCELSARRRAVSIRIGTR